MDIYHEETFGPIAAVIAFDDEDDVIRNANDTSYGLAAYLYTNDLSRALRVAEQLRFGIVGINDINPTAAAAPFGGMKESGLGREGWKSYITNITAPTPEFVIGAYHQLWHVEKSFRMSKHDLQARPIYHHKRFVQTARRYHTIAIRAGAHIMTAEEPLPADLRDALAVIT